jgi:hypothetical protein
VNISRPEKRGFVREGFARSLRSLSAFDVLLYGFIAVGLVLRVWALGAMEFKSDEFRNILNAYRASRSPWSAPLLVAEGTSVSPGAFYYQFLGLPASVTTDPVSLTRFIALLNAAAILGIFLVIREISSSRIALWATALFATAPWMIVLSRKIWNPDLLVPFMTITLLVAVSAVRRYARWKVWALAASLALLCQLHLSVWLAMVPLVPLALVLPRWRMRSDLFVGAGVFVAVYLATLGPHIDDFIAAFGGRSPTAAAPNLIRLAGHNILELFRISSGTGFEFLLGRLGYAAFAESPTVQAARIGFLLYAGLVVGGFTLAITRIVRTGRRSLRSLPDAFVVVLLLMAGSLQLFYLLFRVYSPPHYHVLVALLPPLVVAMLLTRVADRRDNVARIFARVSLVTVLVANVGFMSAFLTFVQTRPEEVGGAYGQPYFVERQRWEAKLRDALADIRQGERAARGCIGKCST